MIAGILYMQFETEKDAAAAYAALHAQWFNRKFAAQFRASKKTKRV